MPVTFGVGEVEFLDKGAFSLQIGDHLLHGDMIIGYGRSFPIAGETIVRKLDDEGRLVRFGAAGDGEGMAEGQVIRIVVTSHEGQN